MIKLQEGQFVRLIGMEVKNENDIYIVDCDYTKEDPRYSVVCNEYCLKKVKLNGEKKTSGYNIVFYNEREEKKNPNMDIKIITDLKAGKKEVNEYLKNRNNNEIIVTFEKSENQEVKNGSIIKFSEGIKFGIFGDKYVGTKCLWKVIFRKDGKRIMITELGKKGQEISNCRIYGADEGLTKLFLSKMIVMDKIETKKGDIEKESKPVENKETKKEVAKEKISELKTIDDLKEGDCTIIVKDTLGNIKEFNGYYNSKFEVVYMTIDSSYKILGYKQSQEQIKEIENNTTDNTKNVQSENNTTIESNNIDCKVIFNEDKNGIELHFNNKPSEDIRNKIKSIGFRWSKFNKVWYIKDSQKVRKQLQEIGLLNNNSNNNVIENLNNIEVSNIELTEINETNFSIDKTISDRENNGHWTFRTKKRDHQQEILSYLNDCKNEYIDTIQSLEDKTTINYYNKWFNGYMNRYYNNYYNRIKVNANNPSWLVTGRSGRNINKDRKYNNIYDNLMRELISLEGEYKTKINKIKSAIQKENVNKIKIELNSDSLDVKSLDNILIKQKIDINRQLPDDIFNTTNYTVNCYNYKDEYYIIKNWGYWRLYNKQGNEIDILGRCHKSLIECKKTLLYVLTHDIKVA